MCHDFSPLIYFTSGTKALELESVLCLSRHVIYIYTKMCLLLIWMLSIQNILLSPSLAPLSSSHDPEIHPIHFHVRMF